MKHTPGPWYMEANEAELYYEVNGETQKMIAIGTAKDESPILAYVPTTWDEDKANARLIAAAPELLEACKVAYKTFMSSHASGSFTCNCGTCGTCETKRIVKQALAQVEGRE